MKQIICKLFGHKYKYNFKWMPSKCFCKRCGKIWITIDNPDYNFKSDILKTPLKIWIEVKINNL